MKKVILIDIFCFVGYVVALIAILNIVGLNVFASVWSSNPSIPKAILGSFFLPPILSFAITRNGEKALLMTLRLFLLILVLPILSIVFSVASITYGSAGIIPILALFIVGGILFFYVFLLRYTLTSTPTLSSRVILILCIFITVYGLYVLYDVVQVFFGLSMTASHLPTLPN